MPCFRALCVTALLFALSALASPARAGDPTQALITGKSQHFCALDSDGTIRCWGQSVFGQIGTGGTPTFVSLPTVPIGAGPGQHIHVSAYNATCAVSTAGGVTCWGFGLNGEMGNGTTAFQNPTPVAVTGLSSGVVQVAVGGGFVCALMQTGSVKCWGAGAKGQMGNFTTPTAQTTPVDVTSLPEGAVALAAGDQHICALTPAGGVKCWGDASGGQLGNGGGGATHHAVEVQGLSSGVKSISAGHQTSCAVLETNEMQCWGGNFNGIMGLGDGSPTLTYTPLPITALGNNVAGTAISGSHTCAVLLSGAVKCAGGNAQGALGDGTTTFSKSFVDPIGLSHGIVSTAVTANNSCALTKLGHVMCWGNNNSNGTGANNIVPAYAPALGHLPQFAMGEEHACAVNAGGAVLCWGANGRGQLGIPGSGTVNVPTPVPGLTSGVQAIASGQAHTCAVMADNTVQCWGYNNFGQLGDGTTTTRTAPTTVPNLFDVYKIAAGVYHTCALTIFGDVFCWGWNNAMQLADGTRTDRHSPVQAQGIGPAVAIYASLQSGCAVISDGSYKCWGTNFYGELGTGAQVAFDAPATVPGFESGVASGLAGGEFSCAVTTSGAMSCWGHNDNSQLGDGTTVSRSTPALVPGLGSGVKAAGGSGFVGCALMIDGTLKCWGANTFGTLGDGTETPRTTPVDLPGLSGVDSFRRDFVGGCAAQRAGPVKCWGYNTSGTIGDGTFVTRTTPTALQAFGQSIAASFPSQGSAGQVIALSATASSGLPVSFASYSPATCSVSGTTLTLLAKGVCRVHATQAGDAVWSPAPTVSAAFLVIPAVAATQTITFGALANRDYSPAPFTVNATASSDLLVTFSSLTPGVCTSTGTRGTTITMIALGTCEIAADQAGSALWQPAPRVTQSFTISQATQTITFLGIVEDRRVTDGLAQLIVPSEMDQAGSGEPLTFVSLTPETCVTSTSEPRGRNLLLVGTGPCTNTVNKAGNALYLAAPEIQVTFQVVKAPQSINFGATPDRTLGDAPFAITATGGASGNAVTFASTTGAVCTTSGTNGATVTLVAAGTCTISANQAGNASYFAAPQVTASFAVAPALPPRTRRADVNGDGRSDVLWYHTGVFGLIGMPANGLALDPYYIIDVRPSIDWRFAGTGDLDGDGYADVIWQNMATGEVLGLLMNGGTVLAQGMIAFEPNLQWRILQMADTDGDGKADLVWKNAATGDIFVMKMNGLAQAGGQVVYSEPNLDWKLIASGDMNGDGKADLLWRNFTTGDVFAMIMDGFTVVSGGVIYTEPNLDWKIVGLADFNGDGKADVLWQNVTTGDVFEMQMNGTTVLAGNVIYSEPATDWKIVALGDYDGDGKADLLWQNTTSGNVYMMLMNGFTVKAADFVYAEPDTQWMIMGP